MAKPQMLKQWRAVQAPWQADGVLIHQGVKQVLIQNQRWVVRCVPPPWVSAPFAHITTAPILLTS